MDLKHACVVSLHMVTLSGKNNKIKMQYIYIYIRLNLIAHLSIYTIYTKHDFKGVCMDRVQ